MVQFPKIKERNSKRKKALSAKHICRQQLQALEGLLKKINNWTSRQINVCAGDSKSKFYENGLDIIQCPQLTEQLRF